MAETKKSRSWRIARALFRWFRIFCLLVLLLVIGAAIYLNTIGVPDFVKRQLLSELRDYGWDVEFAEMRWHWYRGIVIEKPQFTPVHQTNAPSFSADSVDLTLKLGALKERKLRLRSFVLHKGRLAVPEQTNSPAIELKDTEAKLQFSSGDRIRIDQLETTFKGIRVEISGAITNLSALQQFTKSTGGAGRESPLRWQTIVNELDRVHFNETPEIALNLNGDVKEWQDAQMNLKIIMPDADTPWGTLKQAKLNVQVNGPTNAMPVRLELSSLEAATTWGSGKDLTLDLSISPPTNGVFDAQWVGSANNIQSTWTNAGRTRIEALTFQFSGGSILNATNRSVVLANGRVRALRANVDWFASETNAWRGFVPQAEIAISYDPKRRVDSSSDLGFWEDLAPLKFQWNVTAEKVAGPGLQCESATCTGDWDFPKLNIAELNGKFYAGGVNLQAGLDVSTRAVQITGSSDFDVQKIRPLLPRSAQRFLAKFAWETPPQARGSVAVVLPGWTDRNPDWRGAVLPTLTIDAQLVATNGSYHGISSEFASTDVHYSNLVWNLPNILVVRPEGQLRASMNADDNSRRYHWSIDGAIDLTALRDQFDAEQQRWFESVTLTEPPYLRGDIYGRWNHYDEIGADLHVVGTNFVARGAEIARLETDLQYTNRLLTLTNIRVKQGAGRIDGAEIKLDLHTNRLFFTGLKSVAVEPLVVTRCIGRQATEAIEPYRFTRPPDIEMHGALSLHTIEDADLHFFVKGDEFRWGLFRADRGVAEIIWQGQTLVVTNAMGRAYKDGHLSGDASFDFTPKGRADYRLTLNFADVDVPTLAATLEKTNSIEGVINGKLIVDSADTRGLHTWNGSAQMHLRDGLIWDIPIFGVFSPMLNAIAPGLGKSRAREATATFFITNGVAYSQDLEIRASALRMQYRGSIDYEQQVNARVEAEILRDTWMIGRVVSLMLSPITKVFEYRVTGPVENPKMEPVYIPKFLMMTLRPFHTIKNLLPDKENGEPPAAKAE